VKKIKTPRKHKLTLVERMAADEFFWRLTEQGVREMEANYTRPKDIKQEFGDE
jgi:hypothetical protein